MDLGTAKSIWTNKIKAGDSFMKLNVASGSITDGHSVAYVFGLAFEERSYVSGISGHASYMPKDINPALSPSLSFNKVLAQILSNMSKFHSRELLSSITITNIEEFTLSADAPSILWNPARVESVLGFPLSDITEQPHYFSAEWVNKMKLVLQLFDSVLSDRSRFFGTVSARTGTVGNRNEIFDEYIEYTTYSLILPVDEGSHITTTDWYPDEYPPPADYSSPYSNLASYVIAKSGFPTDPYNILPVGSLWPEYATVFGASWHGYCAVAYHFFWAWGQHRICVQRNRGNYRDGGFYVNYIRNRPKETDANNSNSYVDSSLCYPYANPDDSVTFNILNRETKGIHTYKNAKDNSNYIIDPGIPLLRSHKSACDNAISAGIASIQIGTYYDHNGPYVTPYTALEWDFSGSYSSSETAEDIIGRRNVFRYYPMITYPFVYRGFV